VGQCRENIAQSTPIDPELHATVRENLIHQSLIVQAAQSEELGKNPRR
jgi:hypothetical protein